MRTQSAIGADIEDISRFEKLDRREHSRFLERVYADSEIAYCFAKRKPAQHLAARFCAKESVIKALSGLGIHGVPYCDIRVHAEGKAPRVSLAGSRVKLAISLTMAHTRDLALAAALIRKL